MVILFIAFQVFIRGNFNLFGTPTVSCTGLAVLLMGIEGIKNFANKKDEADSDSASQ